MSNEALQFRSLNQLEIWTKPFAHYPLVILRDMEHVGKRVFESTNLPQENSKAVIRLTRKERIKVRFLLTKIL